MLVVSLYVGLRGAKRRDKTINKLNRAASQQASKPARQTDKPDMNDVLCGNVDNAGKAASLAEVVSLGPLTSRK